VYAVAIRGVLELQGGVAMANQGELLPQVPAGW